MEKLQTDFAKQYCQLRLRYLALDEQTGNAFLDLCEELLVLGKNINDSFWLWSNMTSDTTYLNAIHDVCSAFVFRDRLNMIIETYGGRPTQDLLEREIIIHKNSDYFKFLLEKRDELLSNLNFLLLIAFENDNVVAFEVLLQYGADPSAFEVESYSNGNKTKITLEEAILQYEFYQPDYYNSEIHQKFISILEEYRGVGKSLKAAI